MNAYGSFYPLVADGDVTEPVLFAFTVDTPSQRRALTHESEI